MNPCYEKVPQRENSSFFAYKKEEDSFDFFWHYHPEYEITAIVGGSGKRYIADSIDDYRKPNLVMIPPDMPHSWQAEHCDDKNIALVIQFTRQMLENIGLDMNEFTRVRRLIDNCQGALVFELDAQVELMMQDVIFSDGVESLINLIKLLDHLAYAKSQRVTGSSGLCREWQDCDNVNRLFKYINDNFTDEITLDEAAAAVCLSRSAFCRFFKRITGRRFMEHVNDLKVSLACKLLNETQKSITEICFDAGFSNIANFNRQFKKRKAQSPRQYRSLLK